jgi:hypothetical protein
MLVLTGASQVPARDDATTCCGALKNINQLVPPAIAAKWMRAPIAVREDDGGGKVKPKTCQTSEA